MFFAELFSQPRCFCYLGIRTGFLCLFQKAEGETPAKRCGLIGPRTSESESYDERERERERERENGTAAGS